MSGGPVLATLINWIVLFCWSRTWLFPKLKIFNWLTAKKIFGTGAWFLIIQILTLVGNTSDNLIIAQALGASAVSSYAVTQKLFSTAFVSQFFIAPLWPAFGEAMARADYVWARLTLNRTLILSLGISSVTAVLLLLFAKDIISLWVGSYLVPSTLLLVGFSFWLLLASYGGTMSVFLNSSSPLNKQVFFFSAASITSLVLKVVLVQKWQTAGIIWATVFGYGVFYVIPAARLAYGSLKVSKVS